MRRRRLGALFQLRAGHVPLLEHLHRIQRAPTAAARTEEHESVHPFLLSCLRFASARFAHITPLGSNLPFLLGSDDATDPLFVFINATGRLPGTFGRLAEEQ